MKTAEEFRREVYEKQGAAVEAKRKRNRRSALCISLALVVTLCGVGVPRLFSQRSDPALRPRLLQVGTAKTPVDLSDAEDVEQKMEEAMRKAENEKELAQLKEQLYNEMRENALTDPSFSDDLNRLAHSSALTLSELTEGTGKPANSCLSPISLYYDIALLSTGAAGWTRQGLTSLLQEEPDQQRLQEQCKRYYLQHYHNQENNTFRLENSLWLDSAHTYSDEFIQSAEENFFSSLFLVDFTDPTVSRDMTSWVSEKTNGLLQPTFEIGEDHKASILNSLYYRNSWAIPFSPEATKTGTFTTSTSKKADVEFMHSTFQTTIYKVGSSSFYSILSIPLSNGDEMVVFFNHDSKGNATGLFRDSDLASYLNDLVRINDGVYQTDPDAVQEINAEVNLSIPKFTIKQEYDLVDLLAGRDTTNEITADFSNMGNVDLFVSKLQHNVSFSIDENGIEAAASTEAEMNDTTSTLPETTIDVNLDRPFAFAVLTRDQTTDPDVTKKSVVYCGVCGDPTQN